ncbi:unnamed protein product [Candida verbasci]|uniref:MARVEL domain-containing protein n=1 Tax=Candida verbasci TaxID=1227364 RepID=A0A9W4TXY7_9ASCO|nr:unnamed protein product [Candida verbasci]
MTAKESASIALRVLETIFAIVVLGLGAGFLSNIDDNYARVSLSVGTSSLSSIYLLYVELWVPVVFSGNSPSVVLLICEVGFSVLYLTSWAVLAAIVPSNCTAFVDEIDASNGNANCHIIPALITFNILDFLFFTTTMILFLGYCYIPEVVDQGFLHSFRFSPFVWGCIFSEPDGRRGIFGKHRHTVATIQTNPQQPQQQPAPTTQNQEEILPVDEEAQIGDDEDEQKFVDSEEPEPVNDK